jgi:lipopolysaccharide export LptBFGC system permease protein LptF
MYVVLDMIFNFDEFAQVRGKLGPEMESTGSFLAYVGDFYLYQVLLYFVHLSGIIPVVAAAFTLMRMIRFNEVSALLSAGIPLVRLAVPIVAVSILLSGLLWVDQEWIIPNVTHKLIRKHDHGTGTTSLDYFAVAGMGDGSGGTLFSGRYYPSKYPPVLEEMSLVERDDRGQPVSQIKADRAEWDPVKKRWKLEGGLLHTNIAPDKPLLKTERIASWQTSITPEEIQLFRSGDYVELLSTERIDELLKRPLSYGRENLLRVKYSRGVVQILINLILLLLAISAVLTREPRQLKSAAGRCILLCGLCMAAAFLGHELADQEALIPAFKNQWPALMVWLPIFAFGPLSVFLLDRVKT